MASGRTRFLMTLHACALAASSSMLVGLLLGACAPELTPTPTPGDFPRVAVTPAFAPIALAWASTYADSAGPLPFDLEIVHASVALAGLQDGDYNLAIGALPPETGWFATPLTTEPIAIVTGRGSGLNEVSSDALLALLSGRVSDWSALGGRSQPVQPVIPLPEDDLRRVIEDQVMRGTPFASASRLVASPDQALALLTENAGAVALIPLRALSEDAKPLRLNGVAPSSKQEYGLLATVLAVAPREPVGPVRDWLVWIQAPGS